MAKSIKLKNDNYIDSTGVTHNRNLLKNILDNIDTDMSNVNININNINQEIDDIKNGYILYENSNGHTGNLTLNDNIQNYKRIKVWGKNGDPSAIRTQEYIAQEFYTNFQNQFECQFTYNTNGNGIVYSCGVYYYINSKSMTIEWAYRCGLYGTNQGYVSTNNFYAIQKIIGYKY